MLAMEIDGNDNEYAQSILWHIDQRLRPEGINTFEQCLLVEFSLLKGDAG